VLDRLYSLEPDPVSRAEIALSGARLAAHALGDPEGALRRIAPLLLTRDQEAERAAIELAEKHGALGRPLANLFVMRAQRASDVEGAKRDWMTAARTFEQLAAEPSEALEAALRGLAIDMNDRDVLAQIERLSATSGNLERLERVYSRLIQNAHTQEDRVALLLRHADLLERGGDPARALERVLEVCKLAPDNLPALARARELATRTSSHAELLWLHEALSARAKSSEERARHLLDAARVADFGLRDREQALLLLGRALVLTEEVPAVATDIEQLAAELDRARPELGPDDARRGLVRAHVEQARSVG
jgi:tetratricopeptide (TPR) repeat protein